MYSYILSFFYPQLNKRGKNKYTINQANIQCNYDVEGNDHIGCRSPYYHDYDRDCDTIIGPVLHPTRYRQKYRSEDSREGNREEFKTGLTSYIDQLEKENGPISVVVSNRNGEIYNKEGKEPHAVGEVTKIITATTLVNLLKDDEDGWDFVKNDPNAVLEILGDGPVSEALKKVYNGSAPTIFQLLTEQVKSKRTHLIIKTC